MSIQLSHTDRLKQTQEICSLLLKTPHYAKMGQEGIFAIVSKAVQLGIDPLEALNGGLYFVRGKVEMSAQLMNSLIREKKHSITKDPKSDCTICILHGKRADNGDTWTESFSMEDAKAAGLASSPTYRAHPRAMLFARALSILARQLFPDVIRGCYVEGEIASIDQPVEEPVEEKLSEDQLLEIQAFVESNPPYKNRLSDFMAKKGIPSLDEIPYELGLRILKDAKEAKNEA